MSARDGSLRIDGSREKRGPSSTCVGLVVRELGAVTIIVIATDTSIAASSYQ